MGAPVIGPPVTMGRERASGAGGGKNCKAGDAPLFWSAAFLSLSSLLATVRLVVVFDRRVLALRLLEGPLPISCMLARRALGFMYIKGTRPRPDGSRS